MSFKIEHVLAMGVSRDALWQVLTDVPNWPCWFPHARRAELVGNFAAGGEVIVELDVPQAHLLKLRLELSQVEHERCLLLLGDFIGLHAKHEIKLIEHTAGVQVISRIILDGFITHILPGALRRRLDDESRLMLERMQQAAGRRSEPRSI